MSFIPVVKYMIGLGIFGFTYWILGSILETIVDEGVHTAGITFNILHALWTGGLLVYLVFGGWWLIRRYDEKEYRQY